MSAEYDTQIEAVRIRIEELDESVREALKARDMLATVRLSLSSVIAAIEAVPEFTQLQIAARNSSQYSEFTKALSEAKRLLASSV